MPLHSMISARVTGQFYHDLGLSALVVIGTLVMAVGGLWLIRFLDEGRPTPTVDTPLESRSRAYRVLYIGLGLFWILDGLLQLQPAMPNSAFLEMVIAPLLPGQPHWFIPVLGAGIQAWSNAPIFANLMAVWIQLGIGVLLLVGRNRPWGRWALWMTLLWGAVVWTWGEGWGMLLTRYVSWLVGDPGSALLYMLAAVLLLLPDRKWRSGEVSRWVGWGMAVYWVMGAVFQAWPTSIFWTQLNGIFRLAAQTPQPGWISIPLYHLAAWVAPYNSIANGVVSLSMLVLGLLWVLRPYGMFTRGATLVALFLMWWAGQDFGVLGGVGTDPQMAPVLALIVVAAFLSRRESFQLVEEGPIRTPGHMASVNTNSAGKPMGGGT